MQAVTENTLRLLADSGSVREVQVLADGPRWYVVAKVGMEDRVVASKREQRRIWRDLDTLVDWLRNKIGVATFTVQAAHRSGQEGVAS